MRAGHDVAHLARTRKNGRAAIERHAVHHDGTEGLARTGRLVAVDNLNLQVPSADFLPVGDLAGVNIAELLGREVIDGVVVVHDDRDTVVGNDDGSQAQILFVGIESTGGAGDIGRASADGFDASGRANRKRARRCRSSSLKPSAAISAIGRQVVEPATVMEEVEDPEEQAHSVSVSTAALRTDTIFLIASRRSQHGAHRCRPRYGRNKKRSF